MKKLVIIIGLLLLLVGVRTDVFGYSGGTGEPNSPYQIASKADLLALAADTNNYDKSFILTADVNMQGQVFTSAIIGSTSFTGTFDGNGYKVTDFIINGGSNYFLGLFGHIDSGSVKNLGLENFSVSGFNNVGGLVAHNNGSISNCYSTGSVSGSNNVGGLVGTSFFKGSIINCYSTGLVSGSMSIGGLVGSNGSGSIINCYSISSVRGSNSVGGLVGANIGSGSIINCYSDGSVNGSFDVGGLVGSNRNRSGNIDNCYSTSSVNGSSGSRDVGGLVGVNLGNITNCYSTGIVSGSSGSYGIGGLVGYNGRGNISNCFSTSTVSGSNNIGGLVGHNDGSICNCYSTGQTSGSENIGGLMGYNSLAYGGTVSGCFWDTQTSNQSVGAGYGSSSGIMGKTTTEMKTKSTFAAAVWNFFAVWDIIEGQTYPFFKSGKDKGTPDNPYKIAEKTDLLALAVDSSYYDKCFILTTDLDMSGVTLMPIGNCTKAFTGVFDGNGHIIQNATINAPNKYQCQGYYSGLFGFLNSGGLIKNLGILDVNITSFAPGGGLVGLNYGTIQNCFISGLVHGGWEAGGLAAINYGSIINCYSNCSVMGSGYGGAVGGIAALNYGSVQNCYSNSSVTGVNAVGGLVGYFSDGSIQNCYSRGSVNGTGIYAGGLIGEYYEGSVIASFWDIQTSGQTNSAGGTGKTTTEMKKLSTFTSAGWDFSYTDGNEAVWFMPTNDYPILTWEISPLEVNIEIEPKVLNLSSNGQWINARIFLPADFQPDDVDVNSILLEEAIEPETVSINKKQRTIDLKFWREDVQAELKAGENKLTISGKFKYGFNFEGTGSITVIGNKNQTISNNNPKNGKN